MVICWPALPGDVTNVLAGGRKELFPSNWKARRSFRRWCYLADAPPSWPPMRDEPLYISFLPLWMETELHHHSNGCVACTPRGLVISQIAWKKEIGRDGGFWGFGLCARVCVRFDPLFVLSFFLFVRSVNQDSLGRLGWIQMSLTATQLSSIVYFERGWNRFKSLFHNTVAAFDPSRPRSLNHPHAAWTLLFLCLKLGTLFLSLPQGTSLFKRKIFWTVCSFITSLLHSRSLVLSEEDSTWFSLLNKSIFITPSSVCHHQCKQSESKTKRSVPPLSTDKTVTILCKNASIFSSYLTLIKWKSPIFTENR